MRRLLKFFIIVIFQVYSAAVFSGLRVDSSIGVNSMLTFLPPGPACLTKERTWVSNEVEDSPQECLLVLKKDQQGDMRLGKNPGLQKLPSDLETFLKINNGVSEAIFRELKHLGKVNFRPEMSLSFKIFNEKVTLSPKDLVDGDGFALSRKIIIRSAQKVKQGKVISEEARYLLDMYMKGKFDPFPSLYDSVSESEFQKKIEEVFGFSPKSFPPSQNYQREDYMKLSFQRLVDYSRSQRSVEKKIKLPKAQFECPDFSKTISPSIVPFKGGDLERICQDRISQIKRLGSRSVTLFFPVHMQSGRCDSTKLEGKTPKDRGYTLGLAGGIFPGELERCMKKIDEAGLNLNFVPHLEYMQTMTSKGESAWRMTTCAPTDDELYYEAAYKDLFDIISKNGFKGEVDISIAAEIDRSIFNRPEKTLALIKKIKRKKSDLGIKGKVTWNPNGDFHHSTSGDKICENPKVLKSILDSIDVISPSIYEEHGHIAYGSDKKPNYKATKEKFLRTLFDSKDFFSDCSEHSKSVKNQIKRIKKDYKKKFRENFSIGEFALGSSGIYKSKGESSEEHYGDFILQAQRDNPEGIITLWNSGNWDPFDFEKGNGVSGDFKKVSRGEGFFDYLQSCGEKKIDPGQGYKEQAEQK